MMLERRSTRGRSTHALFSLTLSFFIYEARSLHPLSTRTKRMKEYARCVARSERRALIHFKYTFRPSSLISAETLPEGFDDATRPIRGRCRVRPCYHLLLLYICGDVWRAWIVARSNTPPIYHSPLESDQRRGVCSKDLVMSHGPYEASAA